MISRGIRTEGLASSSLQQLERVRVMKNELHVKSSIFNYVNLIEKLWFSARVYVLALLNAIDFF